MDFGVQPYVVNVAAWLLTLFLAVLFGFLLGLLVSRRRWSRHR